MEEKIVFCPLFQNLSVQNITTLFQEVEIRVLFFDKNKESKIFTLPVSQKEIAELFGVTRPSLSRAIRELDQDELIEAKGKNIKILNHEKLLMLLR